MDNSGVAAKSSIIETLDALTWFDGSEFVLTDSTLVTGSGDALLFLLWVYCNVRMMKTA